FPEEGKYLLALPPDRVVLSGTREPWAGFDHRATVGGVLRVLSDAVALAPALGEATVAETRVGFRPASRDDLQLLGPVRALSGAVVATGLGAVGLTYGPYQGAVAARLALGEDPGSDLSMIRPDRVAPAPGTPPKRTAPVHRPSPRRRTARAFRPPRPRRRAPSPGPADSPPLSPAGGPGAPTGAGPRSGTGRRPPRRRPRGARRGWPQAGA